MNIGIIGAGWSGLTAAYLLQRKGHHVTVIEQREHLGGNAYDERDENGVIVPKYGAHIFHTKNEAVWDWVQQFSPFNNYIHHVKVRWDGQFYDYPITEPIDPALTAKWQADAGLNFETACLAKLGERLYEIYIKPYTRKMWGREPYTLSAKLAARVPVRPGKDKKLFLDPYQGFPVQGYGELFKNLAEGLTVIHDEYHKVNLSNLDHLIVTAPLDEWFGCDLGKLDYRGMRFETRTFYGKGYLQRAGTINTNSEPKVLRREEPKQYYQQDELNCSVLVDNYADGDTQFYPVPDARNEALAGQYRMRAASERHVTLIGRLGQYRYLDQDQAILMAMQAAERIGDA